MEKNVVLCKKIITVYKNVKNQYSLNYKLFPKTNKEINDVILPSTPSPLVFPIILSHFYHDLLPLYDIISGQPQFIPTWNTKFSYKATQKLKNKCTDWCIFSAKLGTFCKMSKMSKNEFKHSNFIFDYWINMVSIVFVYCILFISFLICIYFLLHLTISNAKLNV